MNQLYMHCRSPLVNIAVRLKFRDRKSECAVSSTLHQQNNKLSPRANILKKAVPCTDDLIINICDAEQSTSRSTPVTITAQFIVRCMAKPVLLRRQTAAHYAEQS